MNHITLAHGGGGAESEKLVSLIKKELKQKTAWKGTDDDGAFLPTDSFSERKIVFTSDSFTVTPIFFNGGDIGKISACGTINDLTVMGAEPIGLSMSLILEEGFPIVDLIRIIRSMSKVCGNIPIVTGDTKAMEKGRIDKIIINTSGIGLARKVIEDNGLKAGDFICTNGTLGDHGTVILANRFNYTLKMKSDCATFLEEFLKISPYVTAAKDPTRGGLSQCLNEMAEKSKVKIRINEEIPLFRKETLAISKLLGISEYDLPSEGRFVFGIRKENIEKARKAMKKMLVIGQAEKGKGVFVSTRLGERILEKPQGRLIPRIC